MTKLLLAEVRRIRSLWLQNRPDAQIAKITGHSRNTVTQYTNEDQLRIEVGQANWLRMVRWKQEVGGPIEEFEAQYEKLDSFSAEIEREKSQLAATTQQRVAAEKAHAARINEMKEKEKVESEKLASTMRRRQWEEKELQIARSDRMQEEKSARYWNIKKFALRNNCRSMEIECANLGKKLHTRRMAIQDPSLMPLFDIDYCQYCNQMHGFNENCQIGDQAVNVLLRLAEERRRQALQSVIDRSMSSAVNPQAAKQYDLSS
jgi:hypothetical protein